MAINIGLISLGCPKNLVDSEIMLGAIKNADMNITNDVKEADVIIINTCGFIESAKEESINTIIEMCEYKNQRCKKIIVTGCLAQRYYDQIQKEIPEVDFVMKLGNFDQIANVIESIMSETKANIEKSELDIDYLKKERVISTGRSFAYIKISEGCDNFCTYCAIPMIRGRYRSRTVEDIVNETERIVRNGIKEIILVAQDTTRYGVDIYKEKKIVELLKEISKVEGVEWIRLLYCYPEEITDELIDEIENNKKIVKYIDLPIQHASDNILNSMGRRGSNKIINDTINKLRDRIPSMVIRTSLIVGFPGETDEDFMILKKFVEDIKFERLGVFMYSKEEGTKASKMKNQIKKAEKQKRYDVLSSIQQEIHSDKILERLEKTYEVIIDGVSEDGIFYKGRSYMESPDIDNVIYFTSEEPLEIGGFVKVKILTHDEYDLIGVVQK